MSFLLAARQGARPGFGPHAAGVSVVVFLYLMVSVLAAALLFGASDQPEAPDTIPTLPLGAFGPAATLGVMLLPSVAVLLGVIVVVPVLHHRDPRTLIRADARPRWGRAALGAGVWTAAAAAYEGLSVLLYPGSYTWTFDAARFLPLALVALLLVPLQSAAEEVFFRGYLLQAFGHGLGRGWAALLVTSVLFAAVHLGNPEIGRFGGAFIVYYAAIGVVLGLFTLLDDGLELAIGAHAANNLWGSLVVSFPGSVLDTPALLRMEAVPPLVMVTLGSATATTAFVALAILLRWGRWGSLGRVEAPSAPPAVATME